VLLVIERERMHRGSVWMMAVAFVLALQLSAVPAAAAKGPAAATLSNARIARACAHPSPAWRGACRYLAKPSGSVRLGPARIARRLRADGIGIAVCGKVARGWAVGIKVRRRFIFARRYAADYSRASRTFTGKLRLLEVARKFVEV